MTEIPHDLDGLFSCASQHAHHRSYCNTQENSGRSARKRRTVRPVNIQIYYLLVGPACHIFLLPLLTPSRNERSSTARLDVAFSPRSPSSGHPTSITCVSTFPSPSSSFPNLQTGSSRPESFPPPPDAIGGVGAQFHRRSASPVVLHSNRPREWIRGESLMLHSLFPLP